LKKFCTLVFQAAPIQVRIFSRCPPNAKSMNIVRKLSVCKSKSTMLSTNNSVLIFVLAILAFSCYSKHNSKKVSSINIKPKNGSIKFDLIAYHDKSRLACSEVTIYTSRIYNPKFKDSVEVPSGITIINKDHDGMILTGAIDIQTQRLDSSNLDCTGSLSIFTGNNASILNQPSVDVISGEDLESFENGSAYSLTSMSQIRYSGPFETVTMILRGIYESPNNLRSLELRCLSKDFEINDDALEIANIRLDINNKQYISLVK
jgi:hypothetical protein